MKKRLQQHAHCCAAALSHDKSVCFSARQGDRTARKKLGGRALVDGCGVGGHQRRHVGGVHILSSSHGAVTGGALEDILAARGARQRLPMGVRAISTSHPDGGQPCGRGLYDITQAPDARAVARPRKLLEAEAGGRGAHIFSLPHRVEQSFEHGRPLKGCFHYYYSQENRTFVFWDIDIMESTLFKVVCVLFCVPHFIIVFLDFFIKTTHGSWNLALFKTSDAAFGGFNGRHVNKCFFLFFQGMKRADSMISKELWLFTWRVGGKFWIDASCRGR
jgi:hypothetical protein